jgi:hypothetical protein
MSEKRKKKIIRRKTKKVVKENVRENKPFDYKTTIWIGLFLVAFVIVVMAILKFNQNESFDSNYFHDADGKMVFTMDRNNATLDESAWEPEITHVVYYYEGDKVVAVRAFYEYATEAEAEEAYKHLALGDFSDSKKTNGRFVVFDVKKSQYENTTVEELKTSRELLKEINALILDYGEGYVKPRLTDSTTE